MHLADVVAGARAEDSLAGVGEGRDSADTIRTELAIILGAGLALRHFLDVAAAADPVAAELGEAGHDVDSRRGVGVGAAGVVERHRRFAARWLEHHLAHRDAGVDMDFAAAANRAGGDFEFGARWCVGHVRVSSLRR